LSRYSWYHFFTQRRKLIVGIFFTACTVYAIFVITITTKTPTTSTNEHEGNFLDGFRHAGHGNTSLLDLKPGDPETVENKIAFTSSCPVLSRPQTDKIRHRHQHWQVEVGNDESSGWEIVLYSAFYDDRPIVGHCRWIRILGVAAVPAVNMKRKLYCQIWYTLQLKEDPYVVAAESTVTGRDHVIAGNRLYSQRLFSCQLPSEIPVVPVGVSIAVDNHCANSSVLLQVYRPPGHAQQSIVATPNDQWQHQFVVCVESFFGSFQPTVVVEWIEAYHMFGVTRFAIYDGNLTDPETVRVLRYYADRGLVDFRHLPPSVTGDRSEEAVRLGSAASLNDCMMRYMYSARFIVVVDIDEVIVPRIDIDYSSMLKRIDESLGRGQSHHTYSFRNAYFFQYFPEDTSRPSYMRTLRLRRRSPPDKYLFGAKSFVDPRRCLSVFNHYCWIRFPSDGDEISVDVDPDIGLSHHYRARCPPAGTCEQYNASKVLDDTMLKYGDELQRRVVNALTDIGILQAN
jgi:hypothetical protein